MRGQWARRRAPRRHGSPRYQTAEYHRRRAGPGQDHRLRHRQEQLLDRADRDRRDVWHGRLYLARAGAWPAGHTALGYLLAWRDVVRDADRPAALRWR